MRFFERAVTTGNQLAKLTATDVAADDHLGRSVAVSGNQPWLGHGETTTQAAFPARLICLKTIIPGPSTLLLGVMACLGVFLRQNR